MWLRDDAQPKPVGQAGTWDEVSHAGLEQTLVQSLVGVTVESAPKSRGRFWPLNSTQRERDVSQEALGFRQCWLLPLHLMHDLGAGRIYLSVCLLALRQGLV